MTRRVVRSPAALAALALATAACAAPAATPGASPSASPAGSIGAPSASSAPGVVVTLRVTDETYRIRLVDPADIAIARDIVAGRRAPMIPNGRIVRGSADVNTGYSWHIDPRDFEWAEVTIELCDGRPSAVTDGSLSGDRYCPWAATVTAVDG